MNLNALVRLVSFLLSRSWRRALVAGATLAFGAAAGAAESAGRLVIETHAPPAPPPLFFSAAVEHTARFSATEILGELRLKLHVIQGRPEVLTLGLVGEGEVVEIAGRALRDWAVRQGTGPASGKRFLDLRPALPATGATGAAAVVPQDFELVVRTRQMRVAGSASQALLLVAPGEAVGFSNQLTLIPDSAVELRVTNAQGLTPLDRPLRFHATGEARLEVQVAARGGAMPEAEIVGAELHGRVAAGGGSVEFRLRGSLRAQKIGARLRLLSGSAALNERAAGDGWHVELVTDEAGQFAYELVSDRVGALPVELSFAAVVKENGDWRALEFAMPAGAVVPLQLEGLGDDMSFRPEAAVVPRPTPQGWRGFLPANGLVALAWKKGSTSAEAALAFSSVEHAEVRIGAGVVRQSSRVSFRVLQGKLSGVRFHLEGAGEIVGVEGANVVGWKVLPGEAARVLEVRFSRPAEGDASQLTIQAQAELGSSPARATPLRLTPEGGVRHSGFVRVANQGAVRIEVVDAAGLMQLAPAQFPAPALTEARQVLVYRFPSANYRYEVLATQIQPEVSVSAIMVHELGETARALSASVELEVREAALREWLFRVPADYTVVSVAGAGVADHVVETGVANGTRAVRVLFGGPVEGRQLIQLRLEKNQLAAAGEWALPPLGFPGAKSVRGHVGVTATPGYRLVPARVEGLVEVPVSFFPTQAAGLQQGWRLKAAEWLAEVRIEALGQSVQADAYHLYTIREGTVTSSVLLNYFVVGAPVSEWRVEVPATVGNLDVVGQNVRRDWRREGDQVIVSLHQPVLGAATLLLTFEQPMSVRGGTIEPGRVRPVGVQAERGFVHVVSPLQVKHEIRRAEGLLKLEPTELPAEYRLFSSAPTLAAYHYTGRPLALEMGIEWYAAGETEDQVVDFAKLATQVARDGQAVTEATFFVKTRGQKPLRLELPAGMKLWEARVDNALVHARADGKQTLIPLPARTNPNEPVAVTLRLGQAARSASAVSLAAPRVVGAATVVGEWTVRSDEGRLLVPRGGNVEATRPALTETGFEWISTRWRPVTLGILGLVLLGALLLRGPTQWRVGMGLSALVVAATACLLLAGIALQERRVNVRELAFAATVVPPDQMLALELQNLPEWRAMIEPWGVAAFVVGAILLVARAWRAGNSRIDGARVALGVGLLAAGLLAQRGGAVLFFGAVAAGVVWRLVIPALLRWRDDTRETMLPGNPAAGAASAMSWLLVCALGTGVLGHTPEARAESQPAREIRATENSPAFQSIAQTWTIRGERVFAEMEVTLRGVVGQSLLLLRAPAVLTEFKGEGLRIGKVDREGTTAYFVAAEREGPLTARVRFELPLPDRAQPIALPTGAAAVQRVTIDLDQGGWEIASPAAVQIVPTAGDETRSGATLVLAPHPAPTLQLRPKRRDVGAEATQFFVEAANLYVPGAGGVNGFTRVAVRPVQGRVADVEVLVPEGFTVGDVVRGPVGAWRFDPKTRRLHVPIEPAQTGPFAFEIETQRGAGELPFALTLEPPRIVGAASEVGMLALAFGGDAQPEAVRASAMSAVSVQDFDAALRTRGREGATTLQQAWRYGAEPARVELRVAAMAPEVRVSSRQVITLDDERLLMAVDLHVAIARVGLFKLSLPLPEGLEIDTITGAALSQWSEAQEGGQRIVTLHLAGRTLGEQTFNLTLTGPAPGAQSSWPLPRLLVREATRQSAEALVVPGKGIRVRATDREQVTPIDPRTIGGMQPGTLAFRLLQENWVLRLGVELLEPWVTVQALQEVTLREGQTLTRLALRYRVENAAVKHVRVKLPGLDAERARTVRATGPAVSDIVRVADTPDVWEIRFQRGIASDTDVRIEYQGTVAREQGREEIAVPEFVGARQAALFVALRAGGRLELAAGATPRGWTRADWSAVPALLQSRTERAAPAICFRVAEPEGPLAVTVRRHEVAEALKLRVARGELLTLLAPGGASFTAVDLQMDVMEKSTLSVRLPSGARLFNTLVNGTNVSVVRDGEAWLFHVTPSAAGERAATVRMVYSAGTAAPGEIALLGPRLSVPLENVRWRVVVPPGYTLDDYRGALRLVEERGGALLGIEDYRTFVSSKRAADAQQAALLLQQAGAWLQKGEQDKAGEALSRVSNGVALDQASNEDARVQLRSLKTQQAVLGLNTRRQRLYLDHRADASRNEQVEQAAALNPFMQGKQNFDPEQVDQLLLGNSVEENTALRGIAARIVDQQLSSESAPGALDLTLAERGRVLTFTRSVQVDGGEPLKLALDLGKVRQTHVGMVGLVLLTLAGVAALTRRQTTANANRLG